MQENNNNNNITKYVEPQNRKAEIGFSCWSPTGYDGQAQPYCENCGGGCLQLELNEISGLYHTRSNLGMCELINKERLAPIPDLCRDE